MNNSYIYIVRFSGEFGTKDKSTRWRLIQKLENNIKAALLNYLPEALIKHFEVKGEWDKVFVKSPVNLIHILDHISGISSYCRTFPFEYNSLDDIAVKAKELFLSKIKGKRFAVRCKKSGPVPFSGKEVEVAVGDQLYLHGKVDLSKPEVTCFVEIHTDTFFLYDKKHAGMGGLPIGSQGNALCLLSGGFDSSVAAWHLFRSGVNLDFVYFDLGGDAQKACIVNSFFFLKTQWGHGNKGNLYIVDFIPLIKEILKGRPAFQNMILKYCFYICAEKLSEQFKSLALVTGESIGQVSTQTLKNLSALDKVADIAIIRPLVTFDKESIIKLSRQIGTHDLAYKGKELCAIAGKGVVTGTTFEKLIKAVSPLSLDLLIDNALSNKTLVNDNEKNAIDANEVIPEFAKVIDLRTFEEFSSRSLNNTQNIPFDVAIMGFYHWDKSLEYFLVCNVGSQSAILANSMLNEGFKVNHLKSGLSRFLKATL